MVDNKKKFYQRVRRLENEATSGLKADKEVYCSEDVKSIVWAFFTRAKRVKIDFGSPVVEDVIKICEAVKYFVKNTHGIEKLAENELEAVRSAFQRVFTPMLSTTVTAASQGRREPSERIECIVEVLCNNSVGSNQCENSENTPHDGNLFQSFESLYKVIHRIYNEWDELTARGFSLQVFYDYMSSFVYERKHGLEKSEADKLKHFMAIMDGTMKFHPVFELTPVTYRVVAQQFNGKFVTNIETRFAEGYCLKSK